MPQTPSSNDDADSNFGADAESDIDTPSIESDSGMDADSGSREVEPSPSGTSSSREQIEDVAVSEFHRQKLRERREEWQFNTRLASISAAVVAAIVILGIVSYLYNSNAAAETFRLRAMEAAESGDPGEEARWWGRYLMMVPDDTEVVVRVGRAADEAADQAEPEKVAESLTTARRRLADSLARLGSEQPGDADEIRRRLIRRQIQSGGVWLKEAEHQIVDELKADGDDLFAHKALALSVFGQMQAGIYNESVVPVDHGGNYLKWLSGLSPHLVMQRAVEKMPADLDCITAFLVTVRSEAGSKKSVASLKQGLPRKALELKWIDQFRETGSVVKDSVETLYQDDGGRARLALFSYFSGGSESEKAAAQTLLIESGKIVSARLANFEDVEEGPSADPVNASSVNDSATDLTSGLVRNMSDEFWDYQCLLQAAGVCSALGAGQLNPADSGDQGSPLSKEGRLEYQALATQWYDTLITVSVPDVTAKMLESTYLYAGIHAEICGDTDRALSIWKQGLDEINIDNLELNGAIVSRLVSSAVAPDQYAEANEAVEAFGRAIDAERNRLLLSSSYQLTQAQRNRASRLIEMANWRFNVAGAELALRRDGGTKLTSVAIQKYRDALASNAPVRSAEKSILARNLAALYFQHGVYDQAADALSIACDLQPNDVSLHVMAGKAWQKAGNRTRAAYHWKMAGGTAELGVRVSAAQAQFNFMLRSPPAIRDFSTLRSTVTKLENEFDQRKESGEGLPDDPAAVAEIESSIRILKMSVPPVGVLAEQHLASKELALDADELAAELIDSAAIQAYAAERLASVGLNEKASVRVDRVEELEGKGSFAAEMLRARVEASNGKPASAAQRLLSAIKGNPRSAATLARSASNYFLASRDLASSYDALQQIPEDRRLPSDLYDLYRQSKQLASSAESDDQKEQLTKQANDWRTKLREMEEPAESIKGVDVKTVGTFWRIIEAEEKLLSLQQLNKALPLTDPRVIEIRDLLSQITAQRPRWGRAISLKGVLADRVGNDQEAVEFLRAGIDAGDRSLRTRQLLLSKLIDLGLDAQAEEEMRRMAMSVDFVVDPYAKQDIRAAFNRGELVGAVEAARASAEEKPEDVTAQVVFARVASSAVELDEELAERGTAKAKMQPSERSELVAQARKAIERAQALSGEAQLSLAAAALDIEFRHGTPDSVDQVWQRVSASSLPQHEILLLNARVLVSRGDIEGAIAKLKEANLKMPSAATNVQLAQLYQMQGQSVDVVKTLRDALKLQPENQRLRTELAKAIVVQDGESADWDEVESLLRTGGGATSDDQFVLATLLSIRGKQEQLLQALGIARRLVQLQGGNHYEASVLQVTILVKLIDAISDSDAIGTELSRRQSYFDEAKVISNRLASRRGATAVDLYRHAALLVKHGEKLDLARVKSISEQLASMPSGLLQSLELSLIYSEKTDGDTAIPEVLDNWIEQTRLKSADLGSGSVESAAGQILLKSGFLEEGVEWFEKAYLANQDALAPYVLALSKAGRFVKAADVAANHFEQHGDVASATLMVEALLALDRNLPANRYADLMQQAVEKHSRNAVLLEGVATWAMQNGRPSDAIKLYLQVLGLDPFRLRALNNIAMAYAQVPGMASEGLVYIDRALKQTNRNPEILDTKGTVLMMAGRNQEALQVFDEALSKIEEVEPRFQFHKILALLAIGRQKEAEAVWSKLNVNKLDEKGLISKEREQLKKMKNDFAAYAKTQI